MHKRKSETPVISYPPEAVLEIHHVADWVRVPWSDTLWQVRVVEWEEGKGPRK